MYDGLACAGAFSVRQTLQGARVTSFLAPLTIYQQDDKATPGIDSLRADTPSPSP